MNNGNTKFIIGGGISGLIYGFYNRDFQIISPDIGGKLKNSYLTSTILLHDTPETKRLLQDLNIDPEPKAQVMRYFYQDKLQENIPANLKELMVAKKLTPWEDLNKLNFDFKITDTTLSTDDVYIPIFKIPLDKVIKALAKEVKIVKDKVVRITENEIITEKGRYRYTDLISTIPAPVFWKIYGRERNLKSLPETFVLAKSNPVEKTSLYWDLVYFLDKKVPYTRVNRYSNDSYLYEFTGELNKTQIKKLLPKAEILNVYTDRYGIVITDLNNIPPPNVRFVGRFATWNHTCKVQDVIKDSIARYDFLSIWNKQKEFNANFFDFNVRDIELQQKLTKEFVLHIEDEAHELLREVNWKMGQYKHIEVDRGRLLEEWIDVFKYWLGLGNVWGFTLEDFVNEFWRKSLIVDERFKQYFKDNDKKVDDKSSG
ncbi:hypothetical protein C4564_02780 [Candidatus Microgenomates bacterium]|nr:MAG: hypothetical protein C4564_02780 [Candidatus Microgenomates bacterium]